MRFRSDCGVVWRHNTRHARWFIHAFIRVVARSTKSENSLIDRERVPWPKYIFQQTGKKRIERKIKKSRLSCGMPASTAISGVYLFIFHINLLLFFLLFDFLSQRSRCSSSLFWSSVFFQSLFSFYFDWWQIPSDFFHSLFEVFFSMRFCSFGFFPSRCCEMRITNCFLFIRSRSIFVAAARVVHSPFGEFSSASKHTHNIHSTADKRTGNFCWFLCTVRNGDKFTNSDDICSDVRMCTSHEYKWVMTCDEYKVQHDWKLFILAKSLHAGKEKNGLKFTLNVTTTLV